MKRLNEDQLHALNHIVIERLKMVHRARAIYAMKDYQILDRVWFDYHGERKVGTVSRLNQRTISVILDDGGRWNISPYLLKKIESKEPGDGIIKELQKTIAVKLRR